MSHASRPSSSSSPTFGSLTSDSNPLRRRARTGGGPTNRSAVYSLSIPQLSTREPPITEKWIMQFHDSWSRLTLSSFYQDLADHALSPSQFARWLLDRAAIAMSILKAATRVHETLRAAGRQALPLLPTAKADAHFLYEHALKQGFDLKSKFQLSHPAQRLVELLDVSTAPDAPFEVAITAIWAFMLSSWTGWALCKDRQRTVPPHFEPICQFVSRQETIKTLVETQKILNAMLANEAQPSDVEKACKTFEEVVRRTCAVLDNTLYMGEANQVPLCTCGRKGHVRSQCTFKSHI